MSGSSDVIAGFWVHTVSVEKLTGSTATGDTFAAAVDVPCWCSDGNRMIRTATGEEVIAVATTFSAPDSADLFVVGSRALLPSGWRARLADVRIHTSGPLDLPDHVQAMWA
jgi:hypothetical protein